MIHWNPGGRADGVLDGRAWNAACARVGVDRLYRVTGDPAAVTCQRCQQTTWFQGSRDAAARLAAVRAVTANEALRAHDPELADPIGALLVAASGLLAWADALYIDGGAPGDTAGAVARRDLRAALSRVETLRLSGMRGVTI